MTIKIAHLKTGVPRGSLKNRSHRTAVNIIGIAIGIALYVAINSIAAAYQRAVLQPFAELGADLVVQRPGNSLPPEPGAGVMRGIKLPFSNLPIPTSECAELSKINGVASLSGSLLLWEFIQRGFRTISGIDMTNPDLGPVKLSQWIAEGRSLENKSEAVIEKHFAKFHKMKVGDAVDLGGQSFTIVGTIEIKEGMQIASANIFVNLDDARTLSPEVSDSVNVVYMRLTDPGMRDEVRAAVLGKRSGLAVSSSDSFVEMMGGISLVSGWFSYLASGIALTGAVLLVIKSMSASLVERIREIGVLKALGWTKRNIQGQLLGEAVVQCFIGGIFGVILGFGGAYLIGMMSIPLTSSWELNPLPASARAEMAGSQSVQLPVVFSWQLMLAALTFSIIIGCIAAFAMGRATDKMRPASILQKI